MSLLSICIPTLNRAGYLDELLGHIAGFESLNYEVVISDNASEDDTAAVVLRWRPELRGLYYIRQDKRLTGQENAYAVCNAARGDYIFRLSDDDRAVEQGLLAVQRLLDENPDCTAVYPRWHICDERLEKLYDVIHYGLADLRPLYGLDDMANFRPHPPLRLQRSQAIEMCQRFWTVELPVFRRDVFQRHMGGLSNQNPLDFHAAVQFLQHGDIFFVADLVALVRKHVGQDSAGLFTPRVLQNYASDYELFLSRLDDVDPLDAMKLFHMKLMSQYLVASRIAIEQREYLRAYEIIRQALAFRIQGVEDYARTFQKEHAHKVAAQYIAELVRMASGTTRVVLEEHDEAATLGPLLAERLGDVPLVVLPATTLEALPPSEADFVVAGEFAAIEKRLARLGGNPARHRALCDVYNSCRLL